MRDAPDLDDSQLAVAEADVDERLLVTAAAGQGKTEVVVSRLEHLADEGVSILDDVLVLTFSRAAVDAARRRLTAAGLSQARISTFDSFASAVLVEVGGIETTHGFEHRIRLATEALRTGEFDVSYLEHVIVDEAQDLVGDRAELVLALIAAASDAGFTILGDPLQAIYDFQLESNTSHSKRTSAGLRQILIDEHGARPTALTEHYRAESTRMHDLIAVGDALRDISPTDATTIDQAFDLLTAFREKSGGRRYTRPSLQSLTGLLCWDTEDDETTAVLTATNYAALRVSEELDELGIQHTVRPRAQEIGIAPWVASTLHSLQPRKYSRPEIEDALASGGSSVPSDGWSRLKDVEDDRRDHTTLDVGALNRRLRSGAVPPPLTSPTQLPVTVSTVHRAKGLEFDHVIDMVPKPGDEGPGARTWPNLRSSYVASSRARESLYLVEAPTIERGFAKFVQERWVEHVFTKNRPRPVRMELLYADVNTELPPRSTALGTVETLRYLEQSVAPGAAVDFVLAPHSKQSLKPDYFIEDESGTVLGRASEAFTDALAARLIFGKPPDWPERLTGARVSSVETVAGLPSETNGHGSPSGFWLVPRLSGLIRPHWDREKKAGRS